jgi:hypothetical protein
MSAYEEANRVADKFGFSRRGTDMKAKINHLNFAITLENTACFSEQSSEIPNREKIMEYRQYGFTIPDDFHLESYLIPYEQNSEYGWQDFAEKILGLQDGTITKYNYTEYFDAVRYYAFNNFERVL